MFTVDYRSDRSGEWDQAWSSLAKNQRDECVRTAPTLWRFALAFVVNEGADQQPRSSYADETSLRQSPARQADNPNVIRRLLLADTNTRDRWLNWQGDVDLRAQLLASALVSDYHSLTE